MSDYREVVLEKIKMSAQVAIDPLLLEVHVGVEEQIGFFTDTVFLAIRGLVLGETIQTKTIRYPADWWQAFKARWFPVWALLRWPVEYTTHVIDVKAYYPEYHPSLPNERYEIMWTERARGEEA